MITSRSYYKGNIFISNAQDLAPKSNTLGNVTSLDMAIAKFERECLLRTLGYHLYKLFAAEFDVSAVTGVWTLGGAAATKWDELLNGKEYSIDSINVQWRGLVFSDGINDNELNQSLLSQYVYVKWVEENEYTHSGVGFQTESGKNSLPASARTKWAAAWNEFYRLTIGEYYGQPYVYGDRSLYQFITDMNALDSTTYPNWDGEVFELTNRFTG